MWRRQNSGITNGAGTLHSLHKLHLMPSIIILHNDHDDHYVIWWLMASRSSTSVVQRQLMCYEATVCRRWFGAV